MKTNQIKILCVSFFLLTSFSFAQKLSKNEKKLLKSIEANNDDAITFLKKVVNINSGTMNHPGVKEVGMVFKEAYDNIGFTTSWIDMAEVNRSGHLFAEVNAKKSKR